MLVCVRSFITSQTRKPNGTVWSAWTAGSFRSSGSSGSAWSVGTEHHLRPYIVAGHITAYVDGKVNGSIESIAGFSVNGDWLPDGQALILHIYGFCAVAKALILLINDFLPVEVQFLPRVFLGIKSQHIFHWYLPLS